MRIGFEMRDLRGMPQRTSTGRAIAVTGPGDSEVRAVSELVSSESVQE